MGHSALYRLPDAALFTVLAASCLFCLVHAVARSLRARRGADSRIADEPRHTGFQRFFHWADALIVAILVVSGLGIYAPHALAGPGRTTAFWFAWHVWMLPAFTALVVAHVVHEYLAPGHAESMWPARTRPTKYDMAQVVYHWTVAGNLAALALSGAVLWKPLRVLLPLRLVGLGWDFVFITRVVHGALTATLVALLLAHVYFALLVPDNRPSARSMLLGHRGR